MKTMVATKSSKFICYILTALLVSSPIFSANASSKGEQALAQRKKEIEKLEQRLNRLRERQVNDEKRYGFTSAAAPATLTTPADRFANLDWRKRPRSSKWSQIVSDAIDKDGAALLKSRPDNIASFCPNYDSLAVADKKLFWIQFVSAVAEKSSRLSNSRTTLEDKKDHNGNRRVRRGMLQITPEMAQGYQCKGGNMTKLHEDSVNLSCGVRILSRLVERNGTLTTNSKSKGPAAQWEALRRPRHLAFIQKKTSTLCASMKPANNLAEQASQKVAAHLAEGYAGGLTKTTPPDSNYPSKTVEPASKEALMEKEAKERADAMKLAETPARQAPVHYYYSPAAHRTLQ